jgi:hypothetical protein
MRPEIDATEGRILSLADALLTWMRKVPWTPEAAAHVDGFMAHITGSPLARNAHDQTDEHIYNGDTSHYILDKLDPDANRLMWMLLRAVWERRCWQHAYGERPTLNE